MSYKPQRLSKLAKEFNVGVDTILEFLGTKAEGLIGILKSKPMCMIC